MESPGAESSEECLQPGDCVKVAALDRLGQSLTEVLDCWDGCERKASGSSAQEKCHRDRLAARQAGSRLGG